VRGKVQLAGVGGPRLSSGSAGHAVGLTVSKEEHNAEWHKASITVYCVVLSKRI
jgi:hypothetical protein